MLKLTYFNFPGRAWVTRVCLKMGGIAFNDETISFEEFGIARGPNGYSPAIPLGQLPILTLPNGKIITQSGAIARYAAKLANLYPTDPEDALVIEEVIEVVVDCTGKIPQDKDPEAKKRLREEYAAKELPKYLSLLANRLSSSGTPYVVGSSITIADLYIYHMLTGVRKGNYDHVDPNSDAAFPIFQSFIETMEANPSFAPYKK